MFCLLASAALFFVECLPAATKPVVHATEKTLTVPVLADILSVDFSKLFPEQFVLSELRFTVNPQDPEGSGAIVQDELITLCNLPIGSRITRAAFVDALSLLAKKRKFVRAEMRVGQIKEGIRVTIVLTVAWTLGRLRLSGTLIGKDRYRKDYSIEPGELFDEERHRESIERIKKMLAREGYFDAVVTDVVDRDPKRKSVTVSLAIEQGKQFVIDKVTVATTAADAACGKDCQAIGARLQKMVERRLMGSAYTQELVDDVARSVRRYLITKGFLQNTIRLAPALREVGNGIGISFGVELRYRHLFEFHGNRFLSDQDLLDQIMLFGKSATLIPPSLIADELIELYRKFGFWKVAIRWHDDGERIFFFIDEGERGKLHEVVFRGVKLYDEIDLLRSAKPLLRASQFTEDNLRTFLDTIGQKYLEAGFWDFALEGYEILPCAPHVGNDKYQLVVSVVEGKQRFLSGISCAEPYEAFAEHPLIVQLQKQPLPIPFAMRILQDQRQALLKELRSTGRLYARPYPEFITETEDAHAIRLYLQWRFAGSAEVVTFGDTVVVGNSLLPDRLLLRELAYKKGDVWDQRRIERSVNRLKGLGVFDLISLAPENMGTPEPRKTMLLKYVEDSPYEFRARLGIQGVNRNIVKFDFSGISYKAGGSFLIKNPFQQCDSVRFDLDFSRFMHDIALSYHIPWLGNLPLRTEFKVYSSRYDQPVAIGLTSVLYQAAQDGLLCGLTSSFGDYDLGWTTGAEWRKITASALSRTEAMRTAIDLAPDATDRRIPFVYMEPTLFVSSLDNKVQPTRGSLLLASARVMAPITLPHGTYLKCLIERSIFFPFFSNGLVLGLRGRCGTMVGAPLAKILPVDRFYLGGAYSIRSYDADAAPPLNPYTDEKERTHLVPVGGRSMLNINLEARFPIYKSLGGVCFTDFGTLSHSGIPSVQPAHVVGALGVGLRLATGVGPIRFDIGWKLNRHPRVPGVADQRSFAWFLVLGNAF